MLQSRYLSAPGPLLLAGLMAAALFAAPARAEQTCPPSPALNFHLPHLRAALDRQEQPVIVALGSSSTEGAMASDPAHSYPAVLQSILARALPAAHVVVLNRGIGGQDAPEELARLQSDVIAVRPQLVIWQVGANGAMRKADPAEFRRMVTRGVERMQAARIDVVLMDNQHCPRVDATPEGVLLDSVLGQVAEATGANLFSRAALMEMWTIEGAPARQFISSDGLHHNNLGYRCIAGALGRDILATLGPSRSVAANR
jgi:lysophospholipase L1-like esterase